MKNILVRRCSVLIVWLLVTAASFGAIDLWYTATGTFKDFDKCEGVTPGGTWLKDITKISMYNQPSWLFKTLTDTFWDPFNPGDSWSFEKGDQLYGDLYVSHYVAYDDHYGDYCRHGAQMSCYYDRVFTDPENLDWVQIFVASYPRGPYPPGTPIVDPIDGPYHDDKPFYFKDGANREDFYYGTPPADMLIFGDTPGAAHLEVNPFTVDVGFYLFLTSWETADPTHLYIHDGIYWGYDGYCAVPAPGAFVLVNIGLYAVYSLRRRLMR